MTGPETLRPGAVAPAFVLADLDGRARRPLEAGPRERGPVLLVFFKDDCPTCRYALPILGRIHRALAGRGARVFGIAQDDRGRSREFAQDCAIEFPVLPDEAAYAVSRMYGLVSVPALFLVGEDGVILRAHEGFSRIEIEAIAREMADGIGVPAPHLYEEGEEILEARPG